MSQHRRLQALRALATDRGATEAERALAREHIARIGADADPQVTVEIDDRLADAIGRALSRIANIKHPRYRTATLHAAQARFGHDAVKQWQDRTTALPR